MEAAHPLSSPLGRITIASDAIAQIVAHTAAECYGVVGMASKALIPRLPGRRHRQGVAVTRDGDAVAIELYVIVEYGLNLAEVAATIRSQVGYEVKRLTGLPVASVDVHIEDVRHSA